MSNTTLCLALAFIFLCGAGTLQGQSRRINELEQKAETQSGKELLRTLLSLADECYDRGAYPKAMEYAQKAQQLAQEINQTDAVRKSLLIQGKVLQKMADRPKDPAHSPAPADVVGSPSAGTAAPPASGAHPQKSSARWAATQDSLRRKLEADLAGIARQKAAIEQSLRSKESEIAAMSEQQARMALLLARQRNLLDSLSIRALRDSMALAFSEAQSQQQASLLAQERHRRNMLLALAALFLLGAVALYSRYKGLRKFNVLLQQKNEVILAEQKRAEELLLNILPAAIAAELKQHGMAQARQYREATVLFTDFQGFSKIANTVPANKLVADLNYCYSHFDRIIEQHGLEKIKTIGDSYMCAGGLPESDTDHAVRMVRAALDIQKFLHQWNTERVARQEAPLEARIGIHTGPLVAGVVGARKFAYDIWGDTVNIASRVESAGEAGKVNISENTFQLIKSSFQCRFRGELPVKNLRPVAMYFVEGATAEAQANS